MEEKTSSKDSLSWDNLKRVFRARLGTRRPIPKYLSLMRDVAQWCAYRAFQLAPSCSVSPLDLQSGGAVARSKSSYRIAFNGLEGTALLSRIASVKYRRSDHEPMYFISGYKVPCFSVLPSFSLAVEPSSPHRSARVRSLCICSRSDISTSPAIH